MSHAQDARGSAVISRQIRAKIDPSAPATQLQQEQEIARLTEERDRAFAIAKEQAEQIASLQSALGYTEEQRQIANRKSQEAEQEIQRQKEATAAAMRKGYKTRRSFVKASAILRRLPPEVYHLLRGAAAEANPHLDWTEAEEQEIAQ